MIPVRTTRPRWRPTRWGTVREAGAFTCVAEGLDRALACLEAWGILRGRSH
jgi:hypothetical protein